jgi:UDP-4-amino-4,6-dideoxy-N-acetyl-beta-L-altrosamine N-acetyltransferase
MDSRFESLFPLKAQGMIWRPLQEKESEFHKKIVYWRNHPSTMACFYSSVPLTLETHMEVFREITSNPTEIYLGIFTDEEFPQFIGTVGLVHIDLKNRRAEYGRLVLDHERPVGSLARAVRGKNIDAVIVDLAFNQMRLHRLYAEVLANNPKVVKMHLLMGFQEEGLLKQHVLKDGEWQDVVIIGKVNPNE